MEPASKFAAVSPYEKIAVCSEVGQANSFLMQGWKLFDVHSETRKEQNGDLVFMLMFILVKDNDLVYPR